MRQGSETSWWRCGTPGAARPIVRRIAGALRPAAVALALLAMPTGGAGAQRAIPGPAPIAAPVLAEVQVCFVPAQNCEPLIIDAIRAARSSIRVQAYGFTAPLILGALAEARERGVDVAVILDKSNDPMDRAAAQHRTADGPRLVGAQFTAAMRIPTWIDYSVAIAHNKVIVIDGALVIGGSYNFTTSAARRNAENVTFIRSPEVARLFLANWNARQALSRRYQPPPLPRDADGRVASGGGAAR